MGIRRLDSSVFDWIAWRNGSIDELFRVGTREESIIAAKDILRKHAIGWCPSECVPCRPKGECVSVMFMTDGREWWTHMTKREFNAVFADHEE